MRIIVSFSMPTRLRRAAGVCSGRVVALNGQRLFRTEERPGDFDTAVVQQCLQKCSAEGWHVVSMRKV